MKEKCLKQEEPYCATCRGTACSECERKKQCPSVPVPAVCKKCTLLSICDATIASTCNKANGVKLSTPKVEPKYKDCKECSHSKSICHGALKESCKLLGK